MASINHIVMFLVIHSFKKHFKNAAALHCNGTIHLLRNRLYDGHSKSCAHVTRAGRIIRLYKWRKQLVFHKVCGVHPAT